MAVGLVFVANALWGSGGSGGDGANSGGRGDITDVPPATEPDAEVTTTLAHPGEAEEPTCPKEDGSSPRRLNFTDPPPTCIDPTRSYLARVHTTRGYFEITLDSATAPMTVNNFIFLARWHFYDDSGFHRIVPDFVVQGGDPIDPASGDGGPGYTIDAELPTVQPYYPRMSVLMAEQAPDIDSSQFQIIMAPEGADQPPNYTRFGSVTAGVPVVEEIAATGSDDPNGTPTELTVIERIVVGER